MLHRHPWEHTPDIPGYSLTSCAAQVVKLSDAVQRLPRQQTQFVHGVPESFLEVGAAKAAQPASPGARRFGKGAYFIGKVRMPCLTFGRFLASA